ncbi:hypothetical protein RHODGE_RHODGE_03316 [Rhodoplanes serenus]|uniref:Uncharacterized protein n=1 Tax=Rhodoplanes serenus TaxID=200615 RepID=A0A3S4FB51_9BRAD|nr:phage terminase large subunit [Rhodoplanes serenus]VCU10130.1 hypothetical protein RHODGE_RHODGE_03316 [Rhodoplanes serenus]
MKNSRKPNGSPPKPQLPPPDLILAERRRRAKTSFAAWCRLHGCEPAAHHRLLIQRLEAVERGEITRLMVFMPPGSAKSTYASVLFPPWYMGRRPGKNVITASYAQRLSRRFGKRCRNVVGSEHYAAVFGSGLADDAKAAEEWETAEGGEFTATSVDGSVTGRRGDLIEVDDPVKGRKDADSLTVRDTAWEWWRSDLRTRLKPGGAIVLIMCMTGDTPVLMADGSERDLRHIRPGDAVATYRDGSLSSATVLNWTRNGLDQIYEIKTISGISVKANARHPFLVCVGGELKWIRTKDLLPGHEIVRVNGASGKVSYAPPMGAKSPLRSADIAPLTTIKSGGQTAFGRLLATAKQGALRALSTATKYLQRSTIVFLQSRAVSALFAGIRLEAMFAPIGVVSCVSTTATKAEKSEVYSVTTATLSSDTQKTQKPHCLRRATSDFTLDAVLKIEPAGVEEVFDVQIDGTENFIANGLVSHNTRWHEDDPAGRILPDGYDGESGWIKARDGELWYVLSIRAEAEAGDPLGRAPGEMLWPEWFTPGLLAQEKITQGARNWNALYQQRPAPEEGDYFRAEWLRPYTAVPALDTLRVYGASDYAVTADGGDYTVHLVVGVDPEGRMYLLDLWRRQAASDEWVEAFCDLVLRWKPIEWAEETGQIRSGVGPFLDRRQGERRAFVARRQFPTRGDKAIRAQAIRGRMALSGLYVPVNEPWWPGLRAELLGFPAGRHDDQVDALGLVGQLLDTIMHGRAPDPAAPAGNRSGYAARERDSADNDWITS